MIDANESATVLAAADAFAARLSPFDVSARLGDASKTKASDYLAFASAQALDWTAAERARVETALADLDDRLTAAGVMLPEAPAEILLAKTTGREEGNALGYTRAATIFLSSTSASHSLASLEALVAHELFHVLSRANPQLAADAHAILGFTAIRELTLPPAREALRCTNPDAPFLDRQIVVRVKGVDTACVPLLQGTTSGGGGLAGSFDFLLYDPANDAAYTFAEVTGYHEQIGTTALNDYNPEEVSADHFSIGVRADGRLNDPELVSALLALFR